MDLNPPLQVLLYWGGEICMKRGSVYYEPMYCNASFWMQQTLGYDEFVNTVYQYMDVNRDRIRLKIFLRSPCADGMYSLLPVVDDQSIASIYYRHSAMPTYCSEFYINQEIIEILPTLPSVQPIGPMMSLFQAYVNPTAAWAMSHPTQSSNYLGEYGGVYRGCEGAGPSTNPMVNLEMNDAYAAGNDSIPEYSQSRSPMQFSEEANRSLPDAETSEPESEDVDEEDSDDELDEAEANTSSQRRGHDIPSTSARRGPTTTSESEPSQSRGSAFFSDSGFPCNNNPTDLGETERIDIWSGETHELRLGMLFETKQQLSDAVRLWNKHQNRQLRVQESKEDTWVAVCSSTRQRRSVEHEQLCSATCDWKVRGLWRKHTHGMWEITRWVIDHTCLGAEVGRDNRSITSRIIAGKILHFIEGNPAYKVKDIQAYIKEELTTDVSYKKAWYGRRKAIDIIWGDWRSNFAVLPQFIDALITSNPETVVQWVHHPSSTETVKIFKYVFWAFGPSIAAFTKCRPVLSIDGTHLRGDYKGKLLVAVTQDANNEILPVAFAIVDEETRASWSWFLHQLKVFVIKQREPVCIVSDRHQGIIHAMSTVEYWEEPRAFHRFCLRHVQSNLMSKYKNLKLKKLCWSIGRARQMRKYDKFRKKFVALNSEAWKYLEDIGVERWCIAHDGDVRWGVATTNISESFNNCLKGARQMPIKACIEMTFDRTVDLFVKNRDAAQTSRHPFTPRMWEMYTTYERRAATHTVKPYNVAAGVYKVVTGRRANGRGGNVQKVRYLENMCTCGKWQMYRFPCSHVIAVCKKRGDDPTRIVDVQYTTRRHFVQYGNCGFNPIAHKDYWEPATWEIIPDDSQFVQRRAGRVRARRIPNEMDRRDPSERRRCRNCRQVGHNRRSCPALRLQQ